VQLALELGRPARQHEVAAILRGVVQLLQQAALADARLAGDLEHLATRFASKRIQRLCHEAKLGLAAHQRLAAAGHRRLRRGVELGLR